MTKEYGEEYRAYMDRTGMFFPKRLERIIRVPALTSSQTRLPRVVAPILIVVVILSAGFLCRTITLASLPLAARQNLTIVPILPEDKKLAPRVLESLYGRNAPSSLDFVSSHGSYLGYLMPPDYVMQGMVADTGLRFHLFKKHHSIAMVADWVLHPFDHLRRPPTAHFARMHGVDPKLARRHHCPIGIKNPTMDCSTCPYRRVIIVGIDLSDESPPSGFDLFSMNATRTPVGYFDINTRTGRILNVRKVKKSTAWKDVPTPAI